MSSTNKAQMNASVRKGSSTSQKDLVDIEGSQNIVKMIRKKSPENKSISIATAVFKKQHLSPKASANMIRSNPQISLASNTRIPASQGDEIIGSHQASPINANFINQITGG